MIGTHVGSYEITAKLGEGGMGVVYRAKDSQLGREVALKVLPAGLTADPERLARFEREAKLLAQLNHSNIAHVYGLEVSGAARALVMELVEGPTLGERLESGPLPMEESLAIARQIAEALEAAHEKGIVHRDLKPQNIKASIDGTVKVLDFGLAKAMDPASGWATGADLARSPTLMHSPTLTAAGTQLGVILGTAAYMAPEQARGAAVDKRADIWAFGVVLYEMLCGRSLFAADTVSDTLAGVLKGEIDLAALPESTPPAIRRLLRGCLERNPKNRLHDIADARLVLDEVSRGDRELLPASAVDAARRSPLTRFWPVALLVVAAAGVLAGRYLAPARPQRSRAPLHLSLNMPSELEVLEGRLTPDGSSFFFSARRRDDPAGELVLYRRRLDSFDSVAVPGTAGILGFQFSPDSRWLDFGQPSPSDRASRRVLRMPVDGSAPPLELTTWDPAWTGWIMLENGDRLVIVGNEKILRLAGGAKPAGEPIPIDVGRNGAFSPASLPTTPTARGVLLNLASWSPNGYQISTALVDPTSGKGTIVVENGGFAKYVDSGHLLFSRGPVLLGARFDAGTGQLVGAPVTLAGGLRVQESWAVAGFDLSLGGTLLFAPGGIVGDQRRLIVVTPGETESTAWNPERRAFNAFSSDGRSVFVVLANARGFFDLWRVPRDGPAQPLVALADADADLPVVSPDGRQLAFSRSGRGKDDGVYLVTPSEGGSPRLLRRIAAASDALAPVAFLADGSRLLVTLVHGGRLSVIELGLGDGTDKEPRVLVPAAQSGVVSPDGRWLAFASDASGREEVYIAAYDKEAAPGSRRAVSRAGGRRPRWSPDGRKLYFVDLEHRLLAATIATGGAAAGEPTLAADFRALRVLDDFQVLPDGRLLLVQKGELEENLRQFDLIVGFGEDLARRIP